jgi:hypothetical protein
MSPKGVKVEFAASGTLARSQGKARRVRDRHVRGEV